MKVVAAVPRHALPPPSFRPVQHLAPPGNFPAPAAIPSD
jgi:hypothetical protein